MSKAISDFLSRFTSPKAGDDVPTHYVPEGSTGTEIYAGHFDEEYLPEFATMPRGMDTYDKMRRSDAQIKMLRSVVRNPILAANWHIEPVDDSDEEVEIKNFIEHCLFHDIGYPDGSKEKSWTAFISEAMSYTDFGFSLFEVIHKVVTNHPIYGNYIGLRDIAFRSQKTIEEWNLLPNGGIDNVRQLVNGDLAVDVKIPGRNLLVFTCEKEGDNYEGISLLRPIYGNWFRKNIYQRIQAIGVERSAISTPIGTIPSAKSADTAQVNKFKNILKLFTSHQSNYILKPEGFEVELFDLKYDPEKVDKVIENEDKRMAKAFLANFMELGMSGGGGSFALGTDLSDTFLAGIQLYADQIADGSQRKLVVPLVTAKYGVREKYPCLKVTGINDKAGKERAEIVTMLKNAGLIRASGKLEDNLNRDYDLPILTEDEKKADDEAKQLATDQQLEKIAAAKSSKEAAFAEFADKKKDPVAFIGNRSDACLLLMQSGLMERTDAYLSKAYNILKAESNVGKARIALQALEIPGRSDYKRKLKLFLANTSEEATRGVLAELGMSGMQFDEANDILKGVPAAARAKLKTEIELIVGAQDDALFNKMFFVASQKMDNIDSVDSIVADMRKARDSYISGASLTAGATNAVSGGVNTARNAVFQTEEVFQEIESFIIFNPSPEAPICVNLVGRVISKDEYLMADLPPYHHGCKTTVVAQLIGAKNNRPINPIGLTPTGTPDQVAAILKSKQFSEDSYKCTCN